jgi:uncharacterized protein YwgA
VRECNRIALLLDLIDTLSQRGSWCGETHIQKSTYFLQTLLGVPIDFVFQFYKHGPFSFDLREKLISIRADELLALSLRTASYGPSWELTDRGRSYRDQYLTNIAQYAPKIAFVAEKLGNRGVADLERLSSALFVSRDKWAENAQGRANWLHQLKPHVSEALALDAVQTIDCFYHEHP